MKPARCWTQPSPRSMGCRPSPTKRRWCASLAEQSDRVDDSCLHGSFPIDKQRHLVGEVVSMMGFDPAGWRIDTAVHPFATSFGSHDVRITTRWDETFLPVSLYSAMHECG